jgi:hypothetical protein
MGYNMANVVISFLREAGNQRFSTHTKQLSLGTNNLLRQVFLGGVFVPKLLFFSKISAGCKHIPRLE